MIHIATVHWRDDRWIDVQLRFLERNLDEPYRVYAFLNHLPRDHAGKFYFSSDIPIQAHARKLNLLGDVIRVAARDPQDVVIFIDGDAFPVAPLAPYLNERLAQYPLVAVRRSENNGDPQPHPCFCATTVGFWSEIGGDWRRGGKWINPQGKKVNDVGGRLMRQLERAGIDWYPMLRSNRRDLHPLLFGIYDDVVYHHGGGFRTMAGGRTWRAEMEQKLRRSPKGRLVRMLPERGRLGEFRERHDPVERYRLRLAREVKQTSEKVFDLIQRDDDFARELLQPAEGDELARVQAPVVI